MLTDTTPAVTTRPQLRCVLCPFGWMNFVRSGRPPNLSTSVIYNIITSKGFCEMLIDRGWGWGGGEAFSDRDQHAPLRPWKRRVPVFCFPLGRIFLFRRKIPWRCQQNCITCAFVALLTHASCGPRGGYLPMAATSTLPLKSDITAVVLILI